MFDACFWYSSTWLDFLRIICHYVGLIVGLLFVIKSQTGGRLWLAGCHNTGLGLASWPWLGSEDTGGYLLAPPMHCLAWATPPGESPAPGAEVRTPGSQQQRHHVLKQRMLSKTSYNVKICLSIVIIRFIGGMYHLFISLFFWSVHLLIPSSG